MFCDATLGWSLSIDKQVKEPPLLNNTLRNPSFVVLRIKFFSGWWLGHPSEKYEFVN